MFNGTKVGADHDINFCWRIIRRVLAQISLSIPLTVNYILTQSSLNIRWDQSEIVKVRDMGWMESRVLFELSHLRLLLEV